MRQSGYNEYKNDEKHLDNPSAHTPDRRAFPDSISLARYMLAQSKEWKQNDPAERPIISYLNRLTLDNPHIRRKISYIFISMAILFGLWGIYKWTHIDASIEEKGPSDIENKFELSLINSIENLVFFAFLCIGGATGYWIGQHHDKQFDRRANRNLIDLLHRKHYLIDPKMVEINTHEHRTNLRILDRNLPKYFLTLWGEKHFFQDTCEAIVAVIINVAQYLVENMIANKLAFTPEEEKLAIPIPPPNEMSVSQVGQRQAAQVGLEAIMTQRAAIHKETATRANIVIAGHLTRQTFELHRDRIQQHEDRITRLENSSLKKRSKQSSKITPEFVNDFPFKLMREFKQLVSEPGLQPSAGHRARGLSALISDVFLQKNPELQKKLILTYFEPISSNTNKKNVTKERLEVAQQDIETFSALPSLHRDFIENLIFENRALQDLCLKDLKNENRSLKVSIYNELANDVDAARIFCNLNPRVAGILLSRFFCEASKLNSNYLNLAWNIIWSPTISSFSRKKLILTIEEHSLLNTTHIFGHTEAHIQDPETLEEIKKVDGYILLITIIRNKYIPKIKEGLALIAAGEKAADEKADQKICSRFSQLFQPEIPQKQHLEQFLRNRFQYVNLLKHILEKLTGQLLDISPDGKSADIFLQILESVPDIGQNIRNAVLVRLFTNHFSIGEAERLMPLYEKYGMATLVSDLTSDPDISSNQKTLTLHGMALVLIYIHTPIFFKTFSMFSCCQSRLPQAPREKINNILRAVGKVNCRQLNWQVFEGFKISQQWAKAVDNYITDPVIHVDEDMARRLSQERWPLMENDSSSDSNSNYGAV